MEADGGRRSGFLRNSMCWNDQPTLHRSRQRNAEILPHASAPGSVAFPARRSYIRAMVVEAGSKTAGEMILDLSHPKTTWPCQ